MGNTAKQCRLGLFQDSDFAGDLEDSKSTSGGTLCIFGSHTFVPISWMCKKQTAVSHSSTESEIISLDTGLRLDGLPALELWDLIVSVLGNVSRISDGSGKPDNDVHKRHMSQKNIDVMKDIDSVPSSVQSLRQEALLYVFEYNFFRAYDVVGENSENSCGREQSRGTGSSVGAPGFSRGSHTPNRNIPPWLPSLPVPRFRLLRRLSSLLRLLRLFLVS